MALRFVSWITIHFFHYWRDKRLNGWALLQIVNRFAKKKPRVTPSICRGRGQEIRNHLFLRDLFLLFFQQLKSGKGLRTKIWKTRQGKGHIDKWLDRREGREAEDNKEDSKILK